VSGTLPGGWGILVHETLSAGVLLFL